MDWILDELRKNNIDIDMKTLSHHINYLIKRHDWEYAHMVAFVNRDNISGFYWNKRYQFWSCYGLLVNSLFIEEIRGGDTWRCSLSGHAYEKQTLQHLRLKSFFDRLKSYIRHEICTSIEPLKIVVITLDVTLKVNFSINKHRGIYSLL